MTAAVARPAGSRRATLGVLLLGAICFAWQVKDAVINLVALLGLSAASGRSLTAFVWVVLVLGFVIPILAFVIAIAVTRQRPPLVLAGALLVAFCAAEALSLSVLSLFQSALVTQLVA
ncbi:hypothetical protein [uncultured Amnibacterium sp.]|uniref:hypothetical protein n=1 Tax=uncultured Amnibacterium sp. TaxID=1631851 RepID=UPI0035CBBAD9